MAWSSALVVAIWTVFCCSYLQASDHPDFDASKEPTLFCRNISSAKPAKLLITFPDVFSVGIEAVYSSNATTLRLSDLVESYDKTKTVSAVSRFEDGIGHQYIFNLTSKTFAFVNDSTTCTDGLEYRPFKTTNLTDNDPLLFPSKWWDNVSSILDVWAFATMSPSEIYAADDEHSSHEHGIPVDHYYVCRKGDKGYIYEIEICVTQSGVKMPFPGFNGSLPVRIDVKWYNNSTAENTTVTVDEFLGYRLSNFKSISATERETAFLPPPGVPCEGVDSKGRPPLPAVPNDFSVSIEYFDEQNRKIAVNQLDVDSVNHQLVFQYSNNDTGLLFTADPEASRGKIVHDFHYGLQYTIDAVSDACINVTNLPTDAPDAALEESGKREMIMKNAKELIGLDLDSANFYYVGERLLDGEVPADVWVAYKHVEEKSGNDTQKRTLVHEAYFSKPNWKSYTSVGSAQEPTLLAVKTYHWRAPTEPKAPPEVKTLRYHDFTTYPKPGVPWRLFDVTPCLDVSKNDSYLVAFGNDTIANIDHAGRSRVEDALRAAIAEKAGISPLRVTNFYFEAVNDSFWVFFFIADRPKADGTKTKWYENSLTARQARDKLNASMTSGAMSVPVIRDDGSIYVIALNKSSLAAVPPFFSTPVIHNEIKAGGYTGGSMAALGICMLLIGGVLGMVLAFFMWKRNRGIAYQIYE